MKSCCLPFSMDMKGLIEAAPEERREEGTPVNEMKKVTYEIVAELGKLTIDEIKEFEIE